MQSEGRIPFLGKMFAFEAGFLEVLGEAEVGHLRPALVDEDVEVAVDKDGWVKLKF